MKFLELESAFVRNRSERRISLVWQIKICKGSTFEWDELEDSKGTSGKEKRERRGRRREEVRSCWSRGIEDGFGSCRFLCGGCVALLRFDLICESWDAIRQHVLKKHQKVCGGREKSGRRLVVSVGSRYSLQYSTIQPSRRWSWTLELCFDALPLLSDRLSFSAGTLIIYFKKLR